MVAVSFKGLLAAKAVLVWAISVPGSLGMPPATPKFPAGQHMVSPEAFEPLDAALKNTVSPGVIQLAAATLFLPHLPPPEIPEIVEPILPRLERLRITTDDGSAMIDRVALRPSEPDPAASAFAFAPNPELETLWPGSTIVPGPQLAPTEAAPAPAIPSETIAALRQALTHLRKGEVAEAEAAAKRVDDRVVVTLVEWFSLRAIGNPASFDRFRRFSLRNPGWPSSGVLRRRTETALYQEKRSAQEVQAYFADREPTTASGKLALARALDPVKDQARIRELIREAWRKDDFGGSLESQFLAEFGKELRTEDHRYRMERYLFRERLGDAMRAAERAGKDYVTLVKARQAVLAKAANAKAMLDAVPLALRSDTSYAFSLANYHRRRGEGLEAAAAIAKVPANIDIIVDGDEWWVERRLIARRLLDMGHPNIAYQVAKNHDAATPAMRVEAEFHAGWIALRFLKDADLALKHFDQAADVSDTPISAARVAYWRGRAAEAKGEVDLAINYYRAAAQESITYYGQLAHARLGSQARPSIALRPALPSIANPAADDIVKALRMIYAVGERSFAMRFLADAGQELADVALLRRLGDVAIAEKDARGVLVLGKLATRRGLDLVDHAFPIAGIPDFPQIAEAVDPAMIYAIARQESAFDPAAISHAGARGLMQLMPATAKRTAERFKVAFALPRLTSDAAYNAQLGAAHLRELLDEWGGSYILTFASYNAGGHNVKKWIAAYGDPRDPDVDAIDWIERIPFTETRNYVQRVLENLQVYRVRLGSRTSVALNEELRLGSRRQQAASDQGERIR